MNKREVTATKQEPQKTLQRACVDNAMLYGKKEKRKKMI